MLVNIIDWHVNSVMCKIQTIGPCDRKHTVSSNFKQISVLLPAQQTNNIILGLWFGGLAPCIYNLSKFSISVYAEQQD